MQAASRGKSRHHTHNFRLDCSDVEGAAPGWQPDWKIAAKARHATLRPAAATVHKKMHRPTRCLRIQACTCVVDIKLALFSSVLQSYSSVIASLFWLENQQVIFSHI